MAMTIKREFRNGDSYNGYSAIEAVSDGAIVIDGELLILRGARSAATLIVEETDKEVRDDGKYIVLNRDGNGNYHCLISEIHTGPFEEYDYAITNYPYSLVGNSQTILSTHHGSITLTNGLQKAFQNVHDTFVEWSESLDKTQRFHPRSVVDAGKDWLYWAGFMASYAVAHDTSLNWTQKMVWAESVVDGPSGVTMPDGFYESIASLNAPTGLVSWCDPATGAQMKIADSVSISGAAPTIAQYDNGNWIPLITA